MKIVEAQGYSKEKALEATGLDVELDRLKNATQRWKNSGSPVSDKEMKKFMAGYLKDTKVFGAYIVVDPASDDTRTRPYSVINEVTTGPRKTKTTYQIKEAELKVKYSDVTNEEGEVEKVAKVEVLSLGAVVERAEKKDMAIRLMKELIEATKKNYAIEIAKEVVEGQPYAAYGLYTPSKSAKLGKFVFFIAD